MNKNIKLFLIGETGSGKDTIARLLYEHKGLETVVSYTDRPMREGEEQDKEHHFVSKEKALEMLHKHNGQDIVARTVLDGHNYFSTKEELLKKDIYIIDPKGVRYLERVYHNSDLHIIKVMLNLPIQIRMNRCHKRSDFNSKFMSRCLNEQRSFDIMRMEGKFDLAITNWNSKVSASIIERFIEETELSFRALTKSV